MKNSKLQGLIRDTVIFLIGVAIATLGYMILKVPVTFKLEVGFTDLFNFLTNVIFVFLLTQYFNKIFTDRRSVKENIKDRCKIVLLKLEECQELFENLFDRDKSKLFTELEKVDMRRHVKAFRKSTEVMIETIQDTPYSKSDGEWANIETMRSTFWYALTGDSLDAGHYDITDQRLVDKTYRNIRREINKVIISIDLA